MLSKCKKKSYVVGILSQYAFQICILFKPFQLKIIVLIKQLIEVYHKCIVLKNVLRLRIILCILAAAFVHKYIVHILLNNPSIINF